MSRRKPRYQHDVTPPEPVKAKNRIEADISQQAPHTSWAAVPLYYEDKVFTCVDCGREETWTAEQQKWWYETAKGSIHTTAIRCSACRQRIRDTHGGTPRRSHEDRQKGED